MNKVEMQFKDRAIIRGGVFLLSKEDALIFIDECKKEQSLILGIDGFFLTDTTTQPSLENSIDFSRRSISENRYLEASEFIAKRSQKLYFEIVCIDYDKIE